MGGTQPGDYKPPPTQDQYDNLWEAYELVQQKNYTLEQKVKGLENSSCLKERDQYKAGFDKLIKKIKSICVCPEKKACNVYEVQVDKKTCLECWETAYLTPPTGEK